MAGGSLFISLRVLLARGGDYVYYVYIHIYTYICKRDVYAHDIYIYIHTYIYIKMLLCVYV